MMRLIVPVITVVACTFAATTHAEPPTIPTTLSTLPTPTSTDDPSNDDTSQQRLRIHVTFATTFNTTACTVQSYDSGCIHLRIELAGANGAPGDYMDFDRNFGAPTWSVYDESITDAIHQAFRDAVYAMLSGNCATLKPYRIRKSARMLIYQLANCPTRTPVRERALALLTPSPTRPTPLPPTPSPICNQPAPPSWPPDGCRDFEEIAPPDHAIPFACLRSADADTYTEDGFTTTELTLVVDHPEANGADTWTTLGRSINSTGGDSGWRWQDNSWGATCGKDDAQLAWATLNYLNGNGDASAWRIYQSPPPRWFIAKLNTLMLSHLNNKLYFPVM